MREHKPSDAADALAAPNDAKGRARAAAPSRIREGGKAAQGVLFKVGLLVVAFLVMLLIVRLLERPGALF